MWMSGQGGLPEWSGLMVWKDLTMEREEVLQKFTKVVTEQLKSLEIEDQGKKKNVKPSAPAMQFLG